MHIKVKGDGSSPLYDVLTVYLLLWRFNMTSPRRTEKINKPYHYKTNRTERTQDKYVRVEFTLRPKENTAGNLFAWRVFLGPMMEHFKLEERWVKTNFNLIEGTINVNVAIRTDETKEQVENIIFALLGKQNQITFKR